MGLQLPEFPGHVIKVGLIFPRGQIIKNGVCISLQYLPHLRLQIPRMLYELAEFTFCKLQRSKNGECVI